MFNATARSLSAAWSRAVTRFTINGLLIALGAYVLIRIALWLWLEIVVKLISVAATATA